MSISDPNFPIRYDNLFTEDNVGLPLFARMEQTTALPMDERLETLLRLMVFAPYANATPEQWRSLVPPVGGLTEEQQLAVEVLNAQLDYMALVERKVTPSPEEYRAIARKFDDIWATNLPYVSPIADVVHSNYRGLAHKRVADFASNDAEEKNHRLMIAADCFEHVANIEASNTDGGFPVWQSYALFNEARAWQALEKQEIALDGMQDAVKLRKQCSEQHPLLPANVVAGLRHEYFYAAMYGAANLDATEPLFVQGVRDYDTWAADQRAAKPEGGLPAHLENLRAKIVLPPARPADPTASVQESPRT